MTNVRVCLFDYASQADFHGYSLESFDPLSYFTGRSRWTSSDLLVWGINGYLKRRSMITSAAGVDRLYRERDPDYMRMTSDFVDKFRDFDIIVMSTYNFLHPDILHRLLPNSTKILGFVDDPVSTYMRGIPYLWAFDGAFHVSPSYADGEMFQDALKKWTSIPTTWWPIVPRPYPKPHQLNEEFFTERNVELVYVGNPSATKVDRLIELKKHFGSQFRVHGRWPIGGYYGIARGTLGNRVFPHRVTKLTDAERTALYWRTRIGINMHVSTRPSETGNMRMYEVPAHGMMMISDVASGDAHGQIFTPDVEAVYYESLPEAIEKIRFFLKNEEERSRIAKAGFARFWKEYEWETNLLRFLDWCKSVRDA